MHAQSSNASLTGLVTDQSKAVIVGAKVTAINEGTNVHYTGATNSSGSYYVTGLPPGTYRIEVEKTGFRTVLKPTVVLHVQDSIELNFEMAVGSATESVTVTAGAPLVNTESPAVSTVVDRNFAENLPMNGRSFQTLIDLTPGVVVAAVGNSFDLGQFNVNGQRSNSNYWTVDGVSANIGTNAFFQGDALGGALGSFSVLGGTNSLVSVDALQEFRIQTSTYAPEFGRQPGGQISIATRSGTNSWHGTLFDYLRNDVLDANNWFNGFCSPPSATCPLPKAKERQNDFGGTFSGPIIKNRTFFFFSYEGLRLRLPQTALTFVPDLNARTIAIPAMQPYLNAFPLPNGTDNLATGVAQFNASFSNPATLNAYSLRVDHKISENINVFGRYNYSPSESDQRGAGTSLSTVSIARITTQTGTAGATFLFSPQISNDLRLNYSRVNATSRFGLDSFGGAAPLGSLNLPTPFTASNGRVTAIFSGAGNLIDGASITNLLQQWNLVDSVSLLKGSHSMKFGVDYRRLTPLVDPFQYGQVPFFLNMAQAESGHPAFVQQQVGAKATLALHNLGAFAQDAWRLNSRLSLTYGLRWDVDFSPSTTDGPPFPAVTGFSLSDLSQLALAPAGTAAFKTPYGNVAPRLGAAYQLFQNQNWTTVIRGGFGVFFDLATQQIGTLIGQSGFPFSATANMPPGTTFPLNPATTVPPSITPPTSTSGVLVGFDPNLKLPYSMQWNAALEQSMGQQQAFSLSYVGSAGRRLIQTSLLLKPNPNLNQADLVSNTATSDYHALQAQFQRRLSHGLQAVASYTWAHSIDDASSGSIFAGSLLSPKLGASANRAASDFDIRHTFTTGLTYSVPAPKFNIFTDTILRGWSLETIVLARSAPPVDVSINSLTAILGANIKVRPDVVPGIPLFLFGPQFPGGMAINNTPGAVVGGCPDGSISVGPFCPPPKDATGKPLREGNLGRNALRGFGAAQWDFGVHRDFPIRESLKLQFRAEMFNVLNHPNFGPPQPIIGLANFGRSTQMLGQSLSGGTVGNGGFNPLYQIGVPRSIQFALKLFF
jgi:hypothetical protein